MCKCKHLHACSRARMFAHKHIHIHIHTSDCACHSQDCFRKTPTACLHGARSSSQGSLQACTRASQAHSVCICKTNEMLAHTYTSIPLCTAGRMHIQAQGQPHQRGTHGRPLRDAADAAHERARAAVPGRTAASAEVSGSSKDVCPMPAASPARQLL